MDFLGGGEVDMKSYAFLNNKRGRFEPLSRLKSSLDNCKTCKGVFENGKLLIDTE